MHAIPSASKDDFERDLRGDPAVFQIRSSTVMKTFLILILGALIGIAAYRYYESTRHPTLGDRTDRVIDSTRDNASELKDKVVEGSRKVGERVDDARIVTAIKGKYVLDKDLSALAISVSCRDGRVVLTGSVNSADLVARAMNLARETSGVADVTSQLVVRN